ncbi:MAG: YceI family protein [Xanthomonadaceae bacterium]|nr:YceI family protein [Xanthomonadaceae bacterium]
MNASRTMLLSFAIAAGLALGAQSAVAVPSATTTVATTAAAATALKPVSGTYQLDPSHTNVLAQWTHFGFSQPSAEFRISEGTLVFDAANIGKSSVVVSFPIASLDSFVPNLDKHLKDADFFDVAKFPTASFKSTSVKPAGTNKFTVVGNLTIKDNSKPVTLHVTLNGAGMHPMAKQQAIGFSATASIKRSDFGVGAYAPNVSDAVQLRITTEAFLAPAAAK